ncbi:hypothetical protein [Cellulomonas shaoxiangyii]|uniref:DUF4190 domain-containing protein n=1 Tax=Cellulomonas shaoxiangyii TaxID=2566013 RepID=A0A4P7SGY3_9CELL|nr:hypothetical protein [Cellulomonas shaoxiangyii]QCB92767.1 hypothetical protein E5225_03550 [Cellulomonas shaoxiangyii]TGY84099.1 hypothetical protein E5226_11715 [Cellulomonas shaoxiangyii]
MSVPTPGPDRPDTPGAAAPGTPPPTDAADDRTEGTPWWSVGAFALAAVTVVAAIGTLVPALAGPNVLGPVAIVLAVVGLRRGEGRIARVALWTSVGTVALQLVVPLLGWLGLALWSANAS